MPRLIAACVVAGLTVGTAALLTAEGRECPGHWHSTFQVYMDGHRIPFKREVFYDTPNGVHHVHMHGDDQIIHFHPQLRGGGMCIALGTTFTQLGITPSADSTEITFNEYYGGNSGAYATNETHQLGIYYKPWSQPWERVEWASIDRKQMRPGDKLLITYGEFDEETIAAQQASVRDLPIQYFPPGYGLRATETAPPGVDEKMYPGAHEEEYTPPEETAT